MRTQWPFGAAALVSMVLAGSATAQDPGPLDWRLGQHDGGRATAYAFDVAPDGHSRVLIAGRLAQPRRVPSGSASYFSTLLDVEVDCDGQRLRLTTARYFGRDQTPVGSGDGTDWMPITDGDQGMAINIARSVCPGGDPAVVAKRGIPFAEVASWLDETMAAVR